MYLRSQEERKGKKFIFPGKRLRLTASGMPWDMESGLCPRTGRRKGFTQSRNRFNTTIEVLREFLKNGRYDWDKELALTREYVDDVMQTKYAGVEQPIGRLSGGNQQKVIISRWLLATKTY